MWPGRQGAGKVMAGTEEGGGSAGRAEKEEGRWTLELQGGYVS